MHPIKTRFNTKVAPKPSNHREFCASTTKICYPITCKPLTNVAVFGNYIICEGEGSISTEDVVKAAHIATGHKVNLQRFRSDTSLEKFSLRYSKFYHNHVLRLYDVVHREEEVWLVLDETSGTLQSHFSAGQRYSYAECKLIIRQVITAIEYVHRQGYSHGNIDLNHLCMQGSCIKLSGIEHCKKVANCGSCDRKKKDVEAIGWLIYNLLVGKSSRPPLEILDTQHKLEENNFKLLPKDCQDLLTRILRPRKGIALTLPELIYHPWMNKGYNKSLSTCMQSCQSQVTALCSPIIRCMMPLTGLSESSISSRVLERRASSIFALYEFLHRRWREGLSLKAGFLDHRPRLTNIVDSASQFVFQTSERISEACVNPHQLVFNDQKTAEKRKIMKRSGFRDVLELLAEKARNECRLKVHVRFEGEDLNDKVIHSTYPGHRTNLLQLLFNREGRAFAKAQKARSIEEMIRLRKAKQALRLKCKTPNRPGPPPNSALHRYSIDKIQGSEIEADCQHSLLLNNVDSSNINTGLINTRRVLPEIRCAFTETAKNEQKLVKVTQTVSCSDSSLSPGIACLATNDNVSPNNAEYVKNVTLTEENIKRRSNDIIDSNNVIDSIPSFHPPTSRSQALVSGQEDMVKESCKVQRQMELQIKCPRATVQDNCLKGSQCSQRNYQHMKIHSLKLKKLELNLDVKDIALQVKSSANACNVNLKSNSSS